MSTLIFRNGIFRYRRTILSWCHAAPINVSSQELFKKSSVKTKLVFLLSSVDKFIIVVNLFSLKSAVSVGDIQL